MNYKKSTNELFENAKKGIQLSKENQIPDLSTYLIQLLEKYNLNWNYVAVHTGISKSQLYSFTNSAHPSIPSRNQLIAIMFVIGATLHETQNALTYAAYRALYPRDPRDSIIIFYLSKRNRHNGITLVDNALSDNGFCTLSKSHRENTC